MRILLIGYGKMGKMIESLAIQSGDEITGYIHSSNQSSLKEKLHGADAAIEFTSPAAAVSNIKTCIAQNVPVVVGTTGWYKQLDEVRDFCTEKKGSLIYASNFSIGVNLFFMLNKQLAQLMQSRNDYEVRIEETHHLLKKDSPSGTALTLKKDLEEIRREDSVEIQSKREDEVIGLHKIIYSGKDDVISIQHESLSRAAFAGGALAAARWIIHHKGFFHFRDIVAQL